MNALPAPAIEAGPADGPLVLLLHGFPQGKNAWRDVIGPLGDAGLHAVAFDQRGYTPANGGQRRDVTLPTLADDVLAVADALGAERFDVVGHDWGGAVAWRLAAAHADRVRTATILAMPHPAALVRSMVGLQAARSVYAAFFQVPAVPELVLRAGGGAVLRTMLRTSGLDAERAASYTAAMLADGVLSGALSWYRTNGPNVLRDVGPSLVPTLYAWPSADVALGRRAAERTGDHVRGPYRFEVLEGFPHWVPELHPTLVADLVVENIASTQAPRSSLA